MTPCSTDRDRTPRDDLRALEGYHSPQVDVRRAAQHEREPVPAAGRVRRAVARRAARRRLAPLSRSGRARAARARSARSSASRPSALLLRQRQQRGAADAAAHLRRAGPARGDVRTDVRAARAHRARSPAPRSSSGSGAPTSPIDADAAERAARAAATGDRVRVQPEQPDRHGRAARDGRATASTLAADARRAARRRRGVRRVRAVERARARRRRRARSSSCARTRRCGRWPRCGSGSRSRRRGWSRSSRRCCCRTRCRCRRSSRARSRSTSAPRWKQRVASLVEERGRLFAALAELPGLAVVPSGANFLLVPGRRRRARALASDCSNAACSCATSRAGRGVEECLRVTVGTPGRERRVPRRAPARHYRR